MVVAKRQGTNRGMLAEKTGGDRLLEDVEAI